MLKFRKVNHPDDQPKTRSYACRATLSGDDNVVIGSFWVLGNPGYYILRPELRWYETPAHFMSVEIDKLTEDMVRYAL